MDILIILSSSVNNVAISLLNSWESRREKQEHKMRPINAELTRLHMHVVVVIEEDENDDVRFVTTRCK